MVRKLLGHCADCSEHVWDVVTDPKGWTGARAALMLSDGSTMDVTLCAKCLLAPDLDRIWQTVIEGWAAEGAERYAAKQGHDNFILAMSYTTPWNVVDIVPHVLKNGAK